VAPFFFVPFRETLNGAGRRRVFLDLPRQATMITRRTFRPRIVVLFLLTQCALTIGHLRGEKNSEEESFDDDLALDGGSAYDDEWHAGDFAESGGDQDMISQYSKYGADALPSEATWTDRVIPLIEMERIRQEELLASESEEEGAEYYKSEKSNVQRPSIPYNYSVVNTSGYLNRSWADIQKHYGPKLGWWDKTRLRLKRMLEFSRNGASNCINTGGGQVPLYEYCEGCDMLEAQYCLWDMRYNVSGNVRFGCEMDHITDGAQPKCCAQWGNMNDFWTVMGTTSALGDAMLCLQNVGCEKTEYYTTLEEECVFNTCNTLYVNEIASGTQFLAGKEPRLSVLFKNAASAVSGVPFSHHDYTKTYSDVESSTKVIVEQERNGELYTPVYYKNGCLDEANEGNSEVKGKYWKKESGINWDTNWKWNRKSRVYEGAGGAHPTVTTDRGAQNVNLIKYRAITEDWGGKNWHQLLDDSAGDDSQNSCSSYGCQIQGRKVSNTARAELKLRNWADDEVREARQYHDWRKLFLGWDAKRDDKAQTLDDDKYDDDIMIGRASSKYWKNRGTFDQIKDIDRDTRITKMPARCKGCQRKFKNVHTSN
jgi:hypothetical protein